jgi:integrase
VSLTDTRVKAAKPDLSDFTIADGNGLYLRVRRTGAKTWITRRMIGGKVHVQTIGTYPDTTLLEARQIAADKAVSNEAPDKRTVRSLGEQYAQRVLERQYKNSRPVVRYLDRDVYPLIGTKRVGDVVASDIDRVLQEKLDTAGPIAANMLLMLLKGMFGFGVRTGWAKTNPAASFARKDAGGKQTPRQRVLTVDELRAMWRTPTKHIGPVRLAMLTGCRISEACDMQWSHVDFKRKRWTLPAETTKQRREHWFHLAPLAIELLMAQPRTGERVFPGANRMVAARTLRETRTRGRDDDPDYRLHDARRSLATFLGESGVNPLVVELLLGHALPKVLATYNTAGYEAERIAAAESWGKRIAQLIAVKRTPSKAVR